MYIELYVDMCCSDVMNVQEFEMLIVMYLLQIYVSQITDVVNGWSFVMQNKLGCDLHIEHMNISIYMLNIEFKFIIVSYVQ